MDKWEKICNTTDLSRRFDYPGINKKCSLCYHFANSYGALRCYLCPLCPKYCKDGSSSESFTLIWKVVRAIRAGKYTRAKLFAYQIRDELRRLLEAEKAK